MSEFNAVYNLQCAQLWNVPVDTPVRYEVQVCPFGGGTYEIYRSRGGLGTPYDRKKFKTRAEAQAHFEELGL